MTKGEAVARRFEVTKPHVDLELAVREKRFREDLYYRLNVLRVHVPPLRDRGDDVQMLAEHFFASCKTEGVATGFSKEALQAIAEHTWPGNVRELINCVYQAVVMSNGRLISRADLGLERRGGERYLTTLEAARVDAEKTVIRSAICRTRGNLSEAARQLDVSRSRLYELIDKLGLEAARQEA